MKDILTIWALGAAAVWFVYGLARGGGRLPTPWWIVAAAMLGWPITALIAGAALWRGQRW